MNQNLNKRISQYIKNHNILTMALCKDNEPSAHTVLYVEDGFNLYFTTMAHTEKAKRIGKKSFIALTIDEDYVDWSKIRGIQYKGMVKLVRSKKEIDLVYNLFKKKFKQMFDYNWNFFDFNVYKITPKKIYFKDHTKGKLGHREELILD